MNFRDLKLLLPSRQCPMVPSLAETFKIEFIIDTSTWNVGTELISPEDLLTACTVWATIDV